jgi:hypothetical protein
MRYSALIVAEALIDGRDQALKATPKLQNFYKAYAL